MAQFKKAPVHEEASEEVGMAGLLDQVPGADSMPLWGVAVVGAVALGALFVLMSKVFDALTADH